MHSSYNQHQVNATDRRRSRMIKWAAGLAVAAIIISTLMYLILQPKTISLVATETNLTSQQNHPYISGDSLYAYNGLVFYKQSVQTGEVTTLSNGQRLPQVDRLAWAGDAGVLLKFSSSYTSTPVEEALNVSPTDINSFLPFNVELYTWFYDFKSQQLSLVSETEFLPGLAWYSSKDGGFYYVSFSDLGPSLHNPIMFYDIAAKTTTEISYGDHLTDITHIGECPQDSGAPVCIIARDLDDTSEMHLFEIAKDKDIKSIKSTAGRLLPTNNPNLYITTEHSNPESTESVLADTPEESGVLLHDLHGDTARTLDFSIGINNPSVYILGGQFYAIGTEPIDEKGTNLYRSGEITARGSRSKPLSLFNQSGDNLNSTINAILPSPGSQMILASSLNGQVVVVHHQQNAITLPRNTEQSSASKIIDTCAQSSSAEIDYHEPLRQFRLITPLDESFETNVRNFASCIEDENVNIFYGYNFIISGSDPVNGRISTD